jgi:hypothetical protein
MGVNVSEELPRPTPHEAAISTAVALATLVHLLLEKGVFTEREYDDAKAACETQMDQVLARREEEYAKTKEGQAVAFFSQIIGNIGKY